MMSETAGLYAESANRKSDFFRDLAGSRYLELAEEASRSGGASFDRLAALYDKAILDVENIAFGEESFVEHALAALAAIEQPDPRLDPVHPEFEGPAIFIFWHEYKTVVWSLPPKASPISLSERLGISPLARYIAICLGRAMSLLLFLAFISWSFRP